MKRVSLSTLVMLGLVTSACASSAPAATNRPPVGPTSVAASSFPTATPGVQLLTEGPIVPGTYALPPGQYGWAQCESPPPMGCPPEPPHARTMLMEITVPDGWDALAGFDGTVIVPQGPGSTEGPDGAGITVRWSGLTTGLHSDPCLSVAHRTPDIAVGVTVDDFVDAVVAHPELEVSEPVDTELDGYTGRFFTLTGPSDISGCDNWRPWEPGIFVQGPNNLWGMWVIDVDGLRVILLTQEFAGTPAEVKRQQRAMIESIHFVPTP
jgi:hypothetical protein